MNSKMATAAIILFSAVGVGTLTKTEPEQTHLALAELIQEGAAIPFSRITAFRCTFRQSVHSYFNGARYAIENTTGFKDDLLVYSALDTVRGTAKMIGNAGTADLTMVRGPRTVTFVELTMIQNPIVTTIFVGHTENKIKTPNNPTYTLPRNTYLAVMSRHLGDLIDMPPMISQNYGTCVAVN